MNKLWGLAIALLLTSPGLSAIDLDSKGLEVVPLNSATSDFELVSSDSIIAVNKILDRKGSPCSECIFVATSDRRLELHNRLFHVRAQQGFPYNCSCGRPFIYPSKLLEHLKKRGNIKHTPVHCLTGKPVTVADVQKQLAKYVPDEALKASRYGRSVKRKQRT
jgi:hypothetical protein